MKNILLGIALFISVAAFSQKPIPIDSVSANLGAYVTVCAKVYGVKELDKVSFINIGAAYPNAPLTVVIFSGDKKKFKKSLRSYNGKEVCITGNIILYKGNTYEIKVETEDQIQIKE